MAPPTFSLAFLNALMLAAAPAAAATIVVDASGGGDFASIQAALDAAGPGDEILVRPGTYDASRPLDFNRLHDPADPDSPPVRDLTLRAEAGPSRTVITLSRPNWPDSESVFLFHRGETRATVVEGFTIEARRFGTPLNPGSSDRRVGSALYCAGGSSPTIRGCVITGSAPAENVIHIEESSPLLESCTIRNGPLGILCMAAEPTLRSCRISGMSSFGLMLSDGAAGELERCEITRCGPGGVSVRGRSALRMTDCLIARNRGDDGGIFCAEGSSLMLERSIVASNVGDDNGGGILGIDSVLTLRNCVIAGNFTESLAGAIDAATSEVELVACTVAGNYQEHREAVVLGDGSRVVNSIIWGNRTLFAEESVNLVTMGTVAVSHSAIEAASPWPGPGNIALDPRFIDPILPLERDLRTLDEDLERILDGALRLRPESPCIDSGTTNGAPSGDLIGNARPCGPGVDMGAYEAGNCFPAPVFRRGDPNGDGTIDIADAIFLLDALFRGRVPLSCEKTADTDDSGSVDVTDAVHLLGYLFLGKAPPPAPFRVCGSDPTADGLSCEVFAPCL